MPDGDPRQRSRRDAARALVAVAPLAERWIERLLATHTPTLTPPQYLALRAIAAAPVSVNQLARRAGVSGSAASQLLAVLVDAGFVERRPVADDRRRQQLALTGRGHELLDSVDGLLCERMAELIGELPPPELDALARGLPYVEAVLSGVEPPRRPAPPPPPHGAAPRPPGSLGI